MISINYRLGPLRFLCLPEDGLPCNSACKDQLLALRWIRENVALFGGDPHKVLLFGQSAGAVDVFSLSTLEEAPALFASAAMESGAGRDTPTVGQVRDYNLQLIQGFGCDAGNMTCLGSVTTTKMNHTILELAKKPASAASLTALTRKGFGFEWSPVFDGSLFKQKPSAVGPRVPSIIGTAAQEGNFGLLSSIGKGVQNITEKVYEGWVKYNFANLSTQVLEKYPFPPVVSGATDNDLRGFNVLSTIITEYLYRCPAHHALLKATGRGIPVWTYYFNHTPTCPWFTQMPKESLPLLGPTHTSEIAFVFGETDHLPFPSGNCSFTPAEKQISRFLEGSWTRMSRGQAPVENSKTWPMWKPDVSHGIVIDDDVHVGEVDYSVCEFWDKIDKRIEQMSLHLYHS